EEQLRLLERAQSAHLIQERAEVELEHTAPPAATEDTRPRSLTDDAAGGVEDDGPVVDRHQELWIFGARRDTDHVARLTIAERGEAVPAFTLPGREHEIGQPREDLGRALADEETAAARDAPVHQIAHRRGGRQRPHVRRPVDDVNAALAGARPGGTDDEVV